MNAPTPHRVQGVLDTPRVIYLAGPMQGYPEFNFPTFHAVAYCLRQNGHRVFNPAEKDVERHGGVNISKGNSLGSIAQAQAEHKFSLRAALAEDMEFICREADCIVMLPGWEKSLGAQAEHRLALALQRDGMEEVVYLHQEIVELMTYAYRLREEAHA